MENLFVLVQRNLNGLVHIESTNDLIDAIAKQKALLVGTDPAFMKNILTKDEIDGVIDRLEKWHQDRLFNDEEEVLIIWLPKRDKLR